MRRSIGFVLLMAASMAGADPVIRTNTDAVPAAPLGVLVRLQYRVDNPTPGTSYLARYQYRLHTKAGEEGPLLALVGFPNSRAFDLGRPTVTSVNASWYFKRSGVLPPLTDEARAAANLGLELDAIADVNRKELLEATNLPAGNSLVVIRVEPQVYDLTAKKFLTPARTPARLLFLDRSIPGAATLMPFTSWYPNQFSKAESGEVAAKVLADMEPKLWDNSDWELMLAYETIYKKKPPPPAGMAVAIRAMPVRLLNPLVGSVFMKGFVEELATNKDAGVKAAAVAKLAEEK